MRGLAKLARRHHPRRTYSVTNKFGAGYGPSRDPKELTVKDVPRLHSYGFAERKRRGLILVSADPRETQTVAIEFDGKPTSPPTTWLVDSPGLEDTNELDWAKDKPQVTIQENKLLDFHSGSTVELPPGAMMSIEWAVE